jgi:hypothetical protein
MKRHVLFLLAATAFLTAGRTWPPETTTGGGAGTVEAATTTEAGIVELATNREDAANVVVQANDTRLDPFVGSGAGHRTGLVPDPDAGAGDTEFLREDGVWAVPTDLFDVGVEIEDNTADAFSIGEAANNYFSIDTLDGAEIMEATKRLSVRDGVAAGSLRRVGGILCANSTASTALLGTTETPQTFDTTCDIAANTLQVGSVLRITGQGIHTVQNSTETLGYGVQLDAVDIGKTAVSFDPSTADKFVVSETCVVRTDGATGTLVCGGDADMFAHTNGTSTQEKGLSSGTTTTSTVVVDTTTVLTVSVMLDYNTPQADTTSSRLDTLIVEVY